MPAEVEKPTCFIAMPITTHAEEALRYGGDVEHWNHVMEAIFIPAAEAAGFAAVRPAAVGSHMIHGQIIQHLSQSDMVLCDLSGHNPNVFFELGVRTSLNLPITLVRDEHTSIPFDTSGLNTHQYASSLHAWDTVGEVKRLTDHLLASIESCGGKNPMWKHFGLTIAAEGPSDAVSSTDARTELLFEGMSEMRRELAIVRNIVGSNDAISRHSSSAVVPGGVSRLRDVSIDMAPALNAEFREVSRLADGTMRVSLKPVGDPLATNDLVMTASTLLAEAGFELAGVSGTDDLVNLTVRRRIMPQ